MAHSLVFDVQVVFPYVIIEGLRFLRVEERKGDSSVFTSQVNVEKKPSPDSGGDVSVSSFLTQIRKLNGSCGYPFILRPGMSIVVALVDVD